MAVNWNNNNNNSNNNNNNNNNNPRSVPARSKICQLDKAHELFALCDTERKGYLTRDDMQRLHLELAFAPEQLDAVFDSLDVDGNCYLTLEEFTEGLEGFLGETSIDMLDSSQMFGDKESGNENMDDIQEFSEMLDSTGASGLFDDQDMIQQLWTRLRHDEPELVLNFEEFLYRVSAEIRRSQTEFGTLQSALKSKSLAHDEAVQRLYEEMEIQIKQTKDSLLEEEKARQYAIREELERDLADKDSHLQDMLVKHQEMQDRLSGLNFAEMESKHENERLMKEKGDLEDILFSSQQKLEESRMYIDKLRDQQRDDKRERARAAIKLTEGIAIERESLVKQLDMLRDINKKLRDDRDIAEASQFSVEAECPASSSSSSGASAMQSTPRGKQLNKQGSILSNYFSRDDALQMDPVHAMIVDSAVELECNGDIYDRISQSDSMNAMHFGIDDIEEDCEVDYDNELLMDPSHWSKIQNEMSKQQLTPPSLNGFVGFVNHSSHGAGPSSSCHDEGCYRRRSSVDDVSNNISENRSESMDQKEFKSESYSCHDSNRHHSQHGYAENMDPTLDGASHVVNHHSNNCHVTRTHPADLADSASKDRKLMRIDCLPGNHRRSVTLGDDVSSSDSENTDLKKGWRERRVRKQRQKAEQNGFEGKKRHSTHDTDCVPLSPRVQPVGASTCPVIAKEHQHSIELASPQRLFKIVFVGDSGVGKSTFIQQFCHNEFIPTFSATIGVDFQVKSVMVDDYTIALQLWDTAGQERYRSITKQYFRKADGVLVMYDVTSEATFTNVRNWMTSVQEGVDEGTILAIMGNKTDLLSEDGHRAIKEKDGAALANEFGALFYEGSAKTGSNVEATMLAMANLLKEKEDKDLQMAMTLDLSKPKKKGCCS